MTAKAKVSVSLRRDLLEEVDRAAAATSRSQIFEEALSSWLRRRRQAALEHATESYYRSLSARERREDDAWSRLGDERIRSGWDEE